MPRLHLFVLAILAYSDFCFGFASTGIAAQRPNVLFIAVDDLRPELGCYGATHIHSPNIDRLAASGRLFERAYCQQAVCNPSRTSAMTGRRPDSIGVTGNHSHFRTRFPDVITLPQHFKNHGYHATAIGKLYHGVFPEGSSITKWDTMGDPQSWSAPALRFGPRYYYTQEGIAAAKESFQRMYQPVEPKPDDWTKKLVFGPATEAPDVPDNVLYDGKVADAAVAALERMKGREAPFFLAVGFIKPHSPYVAPKKYFDLYADVALAEQQELPGGAPEFAGHGSGELRRYTDQPSKGGIPQENQRRVRQAYYACISYVDAQIGRVLDALERTDLSGNTIVVLWSDHGYHLGEQGLWGKTTNFELDTRVPLVVRGPKMKAAGQASPSIVELLDLYPTLAELAGLPIPEELEGKSFARVLDAPWHETKTVAFSQYPRGGGLMGYSMRTASHRFTQWIHQATGEVRATELYDYKDGQVETTNVAQLNPLIVESYAETLKEIISGPKPKRVRPEAPVRQRVIDGDSVAESFEDARSGVFTQLETSVGTWQAGVGRTIVDDRHAKSGRKCLQLTGGEETSIILDLQGEQDTRGTLSFWAERWTARSPFHFRIDKETAEGWQEVFDGDTKVRVGRAFLNHVNIPLNDETIRRLRFTVKSPANTGVLIDDIQIAVPREQRIVSAEAVPFTLPALVGTQASALAKIKVTTSGSLKPIALNHLGASVVGIERFESLSVVFEGQQSSIQSVPIPLAKESKASWEPKTRLREGENIIWLKGKLRGDAGIDGAVGAVIRELGFSNGERKELDEVRSKQRLGIALRQGGDDGVHTFRIPGLVTTTEGTLIGVYDVRRRGGGDLPGDIDVGMSRSTDGGRTWEPMKTIMDMGDDPKWRYDGIGDPAILVDKTTGTIWVAATWSHGDRSWRGSGPGLAPEETGQLMLVRSDDDGVSWSKPINITKQIKNPDWCFILQGPGKGITMQDGTIVFAAQYQDPPEKNRLPHSTIIYSCDHGETWRAGSGAFDDTTEAQVVEVEPGMLMLNCRYNRKSARVVMTTRDMGKTWKKHSTSERALIEPGACMASLIDVDAELGQDSGGWLLFSNPDSTRGRKRITIKASRDRGQTWPKQHRLLLDEQTSAGYSCMTMIDAKTIGILYEGSQAHMTFQRIPLKEVIGNGVDSTSQQPVAPDNKDAIAPDERDSLRLPRVFGSHMMLQAEKPTPVWGKARAGAMVFIQLGDEQRSTFADEKGNWRLTFDPRVASAKPISMTIRSHEESIHLHDILIGEVWICAGQSNMEWMLGQSSNAREALQHANRDSIRLLHLRAGARGSSGSYTAEHLSRLRPEFFFRGEWEVASPTSVESFSAVAWYFGNYLQKQLGVPVGLICPAVGGTPTEAWIPRQALEADSDLNGLVIGNWLDNPRLGEFCRTRGEQNLLAAMRAGEFVHADDLGPNHSFKPGFMWQAGIEPLIPFAFRGVIWYQGESNAESLERVREHSQLFPLLVKCWREAWGKCSLEKGAHGKGMSQAGFGEGNVAEQRSFPILYVQLPAINRPFWPWFREGQRRMIEQIPNVGMAVTIDTGHPSNVHPALKKPIGERLAMWALGANYQQDSTSTFSGPLFETSERQGKEMLLSFRQVGRGLKSSDGKPLRHFEVAGEDGNFRQANAIIINRSTISVSSPAVSEPVAGRYAWQAYPDSPVNFTNSAELPASPFTTDDAGLR